MKPLSIISLFLKQTWEKYAICFALLIGLISTSYSQHTSRNDSLKHKIDLRLVQQKDQLHTLKLLIQTYHDPDFKIKYSDKLIKAATESDSLDYLFSGYLYKGQALFDKGNYKLALENLKQAAQLASQGHNTSNLAMTYSSMGMVYASLSNKSKALDYYNQSLDLFKSIPDSLHYAITLQNKADYYLNQKMPDTALIYLKESGQILKSVKNNRGIGNNFGLIGIAYAQKGKPEFAEKYMQQATSILTANNDYQGLAIYLLCISDIYFEKKNFDTALEFANRALDLATNYGLKEQISDAYLKLSDIEKSKGNADKAYVLLKNHIIYKDSLHNHLTIQQIADTRSEFEIALKQREIDGLNHQKANQKIMVIAIVIALFLTSLGALGLFHRFRFIQKTNLIIEKEMSRSDHLLNNILPLETATELKERGEVKAKRFESVSVLFTDFKEFTIHSEHLSPEQLVNSVNYYFSKFDEIIGKYSLEKIKTIGDSYMCAGGLPFPCSNHPARMVLAAFEIVKFVEESRKSGSKELAHFDVRIGINTGPVVAGVVGIKKFAYDIWGDTVNVASRMESNCEIGRVNVSENTYKIIKDSFECEYRGEIKVKNKGKLKMFYVNQPNNINVISNQFSVQEKEIKNIVL
ncbi:adenylate/guanylate cyclase domain-containing protein [Lutimonas sp.]|uniref:adenylate/guanylate cyclase domain-containing protein n=1 Tax=Lutimonas sp. TaxID=1872403 RepID=UPI003D9BDBCF